jgi:hypothetical protein
MPKSLVLLVAAAFMAASSGFTTLADAKSKSVSGSCAIKGGRAPCDWVEKCLLDGGIPERRPFSGKLVCEKQIAPAPKAQ